MARMCVPSSIGAICVISAWRVSPETRRSVHRLKDGFRLGGRYLLRARIASGGMADVWEGLDEVLQRDVAVKIMRGDSDHEEVFLQRFRDEALHSAQLLHVNITTVFDYGEAHGRASCRERV